MLDPWIIEEIRRREAERARDSEQPKLEIAEPRIGRADPETRENQDERERGVVIIDMGIP
jgi:hypothetical protein